MHWDWNLIACSVLDHVYISCFVDGSNTATFHPTLFGFFWIHASFCDGFADFRLKSIVCWVCDELCIVDLTWIQAKYIEFKVLQHYSESFWSLLGIFWRILRLGCCIGGEIAILGQNIRDDDVNSNLPPHDLTWLWYCIIIFLQAFSISKILNHCFIDCKLVKKSLYPCLVLFDVILM